MSDKQFSLTRHRHVFMEQGPANVATRNHVRDGLFYVFCGCILSSGCRSTQKLPPSFGGNQEDKRVIKLADWPSGTTIQSVEPATKGSPGCLELVVVDSSGQDFKGWFEKHLHRRFRQDSGRYFMSVRQAGAHRDLQIEFADFVHKPSEARLSILGDFNFPRSWFYPVSALLRHGAPVQISFGSVAGGVLESTAVDIAVVPMSSPSKIDRVLTDNGFSRIRVRNGGKTFMIHKGAWTLIISYAAMLVNGANGSKVNGLFLTLDNKQ